MRQATREDIEALHRVRLAVRENQLSRPDRVTHADYVAHLEELGRGWLIEVGQRVVAFAVGNTRDGNIWALFVDPAHEGRGYGRRLHAVMTGWLFAGGLTRLWLTTAEGTRAEGFYRHLAWSPAGRSPDDELRLELVAPPERG